MRTWLPPLLGLGAALTWGAGDFFAGLASRRAGSLATVLTAQVISAALLFAGLPLVGVPPTADQLLWGAAAGVAAAAALLVYFRGLARGRMSLVASVAAVVAAAVPVLAGVAFGERLTVLAGTGVLLAVVAIALVSAASPGGGHGGADVGATGSGHPGEPEEQEHLSVPGVSVATDATAARERGLGLWEAVAAGLGFGLYFVFLDATGDGQPLWPLATAAGATLPPLVLLAVVRRKRVLPDRRSLWPMVTAAVLGTAGSALFLAGSRLGLLSLVAVAASLSPAATVLLARTVLHEHLTRLQTIGLVVALAGVVLIALG